MAPTTRGQANQRSNSEQTEEIDPRRSQSPMEAMIQQIRDMMIEVNHKLDDHGQRLQVLEAGQPSNSSSVPPIPPIVEPPPPAPPTGESANQPRWRPEEIDYFDPDTRDVAEFTDRIRDIALLRGQRLVATNLVTLLQGQAKRWYNYELDPTIKMAMQQGSIEDGWIKALLARFTPTKTETLRQLERQKYTRHDAGSRKDPVDYLHEVLRLTKLLGYSESEGLTMAYLRLEETLQIQLPPPHEISTVGQMVMLLNIRKDAWYGMYRNFTRPPDSTTYSSNYRQRPSLPPPSQQNTYQKPPPPGQPRPQRQITYPQQPHRAGAYFVDDKGDEWEYDSVGDTYFLASQPPHPPGHTPRAQGNTHDGGGEEAFVNWAKVAPGHRCNHQNCTHYHDEE